MDFTVEKVSDTEGKIITPQPDKEESLSIQKIKAEIGFAERDIAIHQEKLAYWQGILGEFEKAGITEKTEGSAP